MVIVGNAPPDRDLSARIDAAGIVMRMNGCAGLDDGRTGSRTDVVCLRTFGEIGEAFADGTTPIHPSAVAMAREIWFVGEVGNWAPVIIERYGLEDRRHRYFRLTDMRRVDARLSRCGDAGRGASLGIMAITFAIEDPVLREDGVGACRFGFEGWSGHPWTCEKRLFESYCCSRDLHALDRRPYFDAAPAIRDEVDVMEEDGRYLVAFPGESPITVSNTALYILSRIDGETTVAEICAGVEADFDQVPDDLELDVLMALWRFEDCSIIEWPPFVATRVTSP